MRRLIFPFLLLLALASTFLVYQQGLSGTFLFDDGPNIVQNTRLIIQDFGLDSLKQATFSFSSGPLKRPATMLSFALNRYATGLDPFYFKLTNLVIHLLNGGAILACSSLLLGFYRRHFQPGLTVASCHWVSLAVTMGWLLHPLNLTSVLYVVQRMTSLSALFSFWGLALFIVGRIRIYEGRSGIVPIFASLLLFTPMAVLSKESGILLPLLMLVTELTLFKFHTQSSASRYVLTSYFALAVVVPGAFALAYIVAYPEWLLSGYEVRNFTLVERLMTEGRVLWFYIRQIILPDISQMGLFHDDIEVSRGLFRPLSTIVALGGVAVLLGAAVQLLKKAPLFAFGVLFFLAGHLLESTVISLEIAHEHRNYLPMYGILLPLFYYLLYPLKYLKSLNWRRVGAMLLIGLFAFSTFIRAGKWANDYEFARSEVEHHPNSVRANNGMGLIYENLQTDDPEVRERYYWLARQHYEKSVNLDQNMTHGLFRLIIMSASRVKTVESAWLNELKRRLEYAPFSADIGNKLHGLVNCQMNGLCRLSNAEIIGLFESALRNPTAKGEGRAGILLAQSVYLINSIQDYPAALECGYKMVQAAPSNLENRLTLVKFLIALKHLDEAREQLDLLERFDNLQRYRGDIQLQRKNIANG